MIDVGRRDKFYAAVFRGGSKYNLFRFVILNEASLNDNLNREWKFDCLIRDVCVSPFFFQFFLSLQPTTVLIPGDAHIPVCHSTPMKKVFVTVINTGSENVIDIEKNPSSETTWVFAPVVIFLVTGKRPVVTASSKHCGENWRAVNCGEGPLVYDWETTWFLNQERTEPTGGPQYPS